VREPYYREESWGYMSSFEDWWDLAMTVLDYGRRIRNWTSFNGYTVEGNSLRVHIVLSSKKEQSDWNNGYPFSALDDWIVCAQIKGERVATVSKKEFQDRYDSWPAYRNNKIMRKDFDGKTKASPYLISIFHEFDRLMSLDLDVSKPSDLA